MRDYDKIMWDGLISALMDIIAIVILVHLAFGGDWSSLHPVAITLCRGMLLLFCAVLILKDTPLFWRSILQMIDLRTEPEERTGKIYSMFGNMLDVFYKTKITEIKFWGDYKGRGHKLHMCFGVQSIGMFEDDDRVAYKIYPRSRVIVEMRKCPILPAKVTSIKSAAELKRLIEAQEEVTFLFRKNEYALSGYYTKRFLRPERFEYLFVRYSDDSSQKETFYDFEDALQVKLSKGKRLGEVLEEIQIVS